MNKDTKTVVILASLMVVPTVFKSILTVKAERKKREVIAANLQRDLIAINVAAARVQERLGTGSYKTIGEVMNDFEFEIIVRDFEK